MDLDDELDLILARRDRRNMQPTINALLPSSPAITANAARIRSIPQRKQ